MSSPTSVEIRGIWKTFPAANGERFLAIEDVHLDMAPGEVVSIVGPSGCGKSTLLNIVAGLLPYDRGTMRFGGTDDALDGGRIGIVFQDPELLPWRDALSNTLFGAELQSRKLAKQMRPRAEHLLRLVGLGSFTHSYPGQLSGGMKQRNAVARALLLEPSILLMDEPFGALDALTRERITLDLQDIVARSGSTVTFVTHSISEAVVLGNRVVVMGTSPGRIIEIVDVDLPRPRPVSLAADTEFVRATERIRELLGRVSWIFG